MFGRRKRVLAEVGAQAPSFRLTGVDGCERSLAEILTGGPALLAFYKVSCPVCQLTAPYLQRLQDFQVPQVRVTPQALVLTLEFALVVR